MSSISKIQNPITAEDNAPELPHDNSYSHRENHICYPISTDEFILSCGAIYTNNLELTTDKTGLILHGTFHYILGGIFPLPTCFVMDPTKPDKEWGAKTTRVKEMSIDVMTANLPVDKLLKRTNHYHKVVNYYETHLPGTLTYSTIRELILSILMAESVSLKSHPEGMTPKELQEWKGQMVRMLNSLGTPDTQVTCVRNFYPTGNSAETPIRITWTDGMFVNDPKGLIVDMGSGGWRLYKFNEKTSQCECIARNDYPDNCWTDPAIQTKTLREIKQALNTYVSETKSSVNCTVACTGNWRKDSYKTIFESMNTELTSLCESASINLDILTLSGELEAQYMGQCALKYFQPQFFDRTYWRCVEGGKGSVQISEQAVSSST